MNSMELSNYLEKIRYGRNLSQEEFVYGIVSIRQYQRYKSGVSVIPYEKIDQFAEKLGINSKRLLSEFEKEKSLQYNRINGFYNAVANGDIEAVKKYKTEIESDFIISEEGRKYYKHATIVHQFYSKRISKQEAIEQVSDLINYPDILNQRFFTDVEVLILSFLLSVFSGKQQDVLLMKLNSLFDSEDTIMTGDTDYIYILILMRIAKIFGIKKDYEKVIFYCNLGVKRGIEHKQYYLWEYFLYYKALAHYRLDQMEEYRNALVRCFYVLNMEQNDNKVHKFTKLIEKDFEISYQEFVIRTLEADLKRKNRESN